ncbi:ABC transporter ATP-binding protein [Actinomadura parmotrematis]|uniref:ABC transporter ATP-binding protein n=1 Tax=Actinomadura parmotrematis TaxID=2864039 RepID=A0ABS7FKT8_9ACTN|nr:ABC transporter ATP-binding protein [Actinomadura parmotrematis]MBW8480973.1 ABC transporter ATP-binding protein [Actinomadura parmotrematis]
MIQARGLTKRYGHRTAVDHADFTVRPGHVTGFLGPNGAGKSTTMRMILGLDRPTSGDVTVGGRRYPELGAPLREVGALLDAKAVHPGRSARNHLRCLAQSNGIPERRVDEVLALVGLESVAGKPSRGFSLGMGQRLGIAAALLGDPPVLMFDEPVNGLDPEGILWIRNLMRNLAAEGRTVFVSSHLMSEMALTADHLVVIGRGRILADTGMRDFIDANATSHVLVRTPQAGHLGPLLAARDWRVEVEADQALRVYGASADQIGDVAADHGFRLHELSPVQPSLEEAFMQLTGDTVEYHAGGPARPAAGSGDGPPAAGGGLPQAPPPPPPTIGDDLHGGGHRA